MKIILARPDEISEYHDQIINILIEYHRIKYDEKYYDDFENHCKIYAEHALKNSYKIGFVLIDDKIVSIQLLYPVNDYMKEYISSKAKRDLSYIQHELSSVYTKPEYQNRRLGTQLSEKMLLEENVYAATTLKNLCMRAILKHNGFKKTGPRFRSDSGPMNIYIRNKK